MTEEVNCVSAKTYTFDAAGRLAKGNNLATGEHSNYLYHALGARIGLQQRLLNGEGSHADRETDYVIDYTNNLRNDIMLVEKDGYSSSVLYGRGIERLSKTVRSTSSPGVETWEKVFFQHDLLWSSMFAADSDGQVTSHTSFDPWGNLTDPDPANRFIHFTNHSYDRAIDKYHAQARFYDARNGRMMSLDPAYADANLYRYALNNPVNYVDVDGEVPVILVAFGKFFVKNFAVGAATELASQVVWGRDGDRKIDWLSVGAAGLNSVVTAGARRIPSRWVRNTVTLASNVGTNLWQDRTNGLNRTTVTRAVTRGIISTAMRDPWSYGVDFMLDGVSQNRPRLTQSITSSSRWPSSPIRPPVIGGRVPSNTPLRQGSGQSASRPAARSAAAGIAALAQRNAAARAGTGGVSPGSIASGSNQQNMGLSRDPRANSGPTTSRNLLPSGFSGLKAVRKPLVPIRPRVTLPIRGFTGFGSSSSSRSSRPSGFSGFSGFGVSRSSRPSAFSRSYVFSGFSNSRRTRS